MGSASDHDQHPAQVSTRARLAMVAGCHVDGGAGGIARPGGPRLRLRRVDQDVTGSGSSSSGSWRSSRRMRRVCAAAGSRTSRSDHQPWWGGVVPDQRRPGQRPQSQQPKARGGRQSVPRVVAWRGAGPGAALRPEDRGRGGGPAACACTASGIPRPGQPGRVRQQQVRRELACIPGREQGLHRTTTGRADTRCARKGLANRGVFPAGGAVAARLPCRATGPACW